MTKMFATMTSKWSDHSSGARAMFALIETVFVLERVMLLSRSATEQTPLYTFDKKLARQPADADLLRS